MTVIIAFIHDLNVDLDTGSVIYFWDSQKMVPFP
jgi:hypothetical protein